MDEPATKHCAHCNETKSVEAFALRRKSGRYCRQSWCRACQQAYHRGHPRVMAARRVIRDAKNRPCADCGVQYPYYVMDFDHRPGEGKRGGFNVLVKRGTAIEVLLDEIARCDLVCANCHRIRTYRRKQNYYVENV